MTEIPLPHDQFRVSNTHFDPLGPYPVQFDVAVPEFFRLTAHFEEGWLRASPATRSLVLYRVQSDRLKLLGRGMLADCREVPGIAEPNCFSISVSVAAFNLSYREGDDALNLLRPAEHALWSSHDVVRVRVERRRGQFVLRFIADADAHLLLADRATASPTPAACLHCKKNAPVSAGALSLE